jgi:hypothetical protein
VSLRTDPTEIVPSLEALSIAFRCSPTLYCDQRTTDDLITAIDGLTPSLYFLVRKNEVFRYVVYGVYHKNDPVAMHRHDFEGIVIEEPIGGSVSATMSISHLQYIFTPGFRDCFYIAAGSHAIGPKVVDSAQVKYRPGDLSLQNMALWTKDDRERIDHMFGEPVKTPWRWVDRQMETWAQQKHPTVGGHTYWTTRGLLWKAPETVFEIARRMGKLKEDV